MRGQSSTNTTDPCPLILYSKKGVQWSSIWSVTLVFGETPTIRNPWRWLNNNKTRKGGTLVEHSFGRAGVAHYPAPGFSDPGPLFGRGGRGYVTPTQATSYRNNVTTRTPPTFHRNAPCARHRIDPHATPCPLGSSPSDTSWLQADPEGRLYPREPAASWSTSPKPHVPLRCRVHRRCGNNFPFNDPKCHRADGNVLRTIPTSRPMPSC